MRVALLLFLFLMPCIMRADDAKPLSTDEAAKKVGEKVTLEMQVLSGAQSRQGIVFLNSMANRNDGKNFVVIIKKDSVEKFKKAINAEPKDHYKNKTIRVTGTVSLYMNRPQIEVTEAEQIKVVEKK